MTSPLTSRAYPSQPPAPKQAPAGYTTPTAPNNLSIDPPMTPEQIGAQRLAIIELILRQVLLAVVGVFIPGVTSFQQISDWAATIPIFGDLFEAITGVEDGDLTDLGTFFLNLRNFLAGLNFLDIAFDVPTAAVTFITNILNPTGLLALAADVASDIAAAVLSIISAITGGVGTTISDLTTMFTNIASFLYVDFLSPAFNVADAAYDFIINILSPSGLLTVVGDIVSTVVAFINDVINLGAGGGSSFPYTFPIRFADGGPIARFFRNIALLLDLNLADIAFDLGSAILTVMSQLGIQQIIDYIYNAFTYGVGGILTTVGNAVSTVFDTIFGIFGTAFGAQTTAASILAQISASSAGGTSVVDSFDYAAASDMPGAHYDRVDVGAGSGTYGPSGTGYIAWNFGSGTSHTSFYRRNDTTLSSDHGEVHVVLASGLNPNSLGPDPSLYLAGRGNAANTEAVMAKLTNDSIQFQYVLAGTATNIGSPVTWNFSSGDHIIFRFGIGGADRRYQLLVNNSIKADVTEGGTSSVLGASNRRCGFGADYQHPVYPPYLTIFAMADQTY